MLEVEKLNSILEKTVGLRVKRLATDFIKKEVSIYFENENSITFLECGLVYDLGIIGFCIGGFSRDAGLGMTQELNKLTLNSEEYLFCTLSRDFKDFKNKNEIRISFKNFKSDITPNF